MATTGTAAASLFVLLSLNCSFHTLFQRRAKLMRERENDMSLAKNTLKRKRRRRCADPRCCRFLLQSVSQTQTSANLSSSHTATGTTYLLTTAQLKLIRITRTHTSTALGLLLSIEQTSSRELQRAEFPLQSVFLANLKQLLLLLSFPS